MRRPGPILPRVLALALAAYAALVPFGVAPALAEPQILVQHARGEASVPLHPRTVLVFDLAALDTLEALGVEVAGVPGSHIPDYLAKYRSERYARIGSLFEPDFEAVNAAAPDLIIVGPRSSSRYPELARIAPTIDMTIGAAAFVPGVRANVATLGRIFGKEAEARALVDGIDAATARLRADSPRAGTVLLLMVNGGKLSIFGPGSRFGWLHDELGLKPAVKAEATTHGEVVSFEFLAETDPDWLVVLDRDAAVGQAPVSARQVLDNDLVRATRAAKAGRIHYVDPARWYLVGGGGMAFRDVVNELAAAIEASPKP